MNASVVGSGYVGTTLATCLADLAHQADDILEVVGVGHGDRAAVVLAAVEEPALDTSEPHGAEQAVPSGFASICSTPIILRLSGPATDRQRSACP